MRGGMVPSENEASFAAKPQAKNLKKKKRKCHKENKPSSYYLVGATTLFFAALFANDG